MWTAEDTYGVVHPGVAFAATEPTQLMGGGAEHTGSTGLRTLVDPNNPLVWFAGLLLVTVGAAGIAGSVRLGPAKVGASVGKAG
jgi:hypothetical protein